MMRKTYFGFAFLVSLATIQPAAAGELFGVSFAGTLYTINPTTGAGTPVGSGLHAVLGLAFAPDGTLFGANASTDQLVTIDPTTGVATPVGPLGFGSVNGLSFSLDGTLFGIDDSTDKLLTIDTTTGAATAVGPLGGGPAAYTGLAFAPDGTLFGVDAYRDVLLTIDPTTGAATEVGPMTGTIAIGGLAFAPDGTLFGADYGGGTALFTIDPTTGAATPAVGSTNLDIRALAFAPEPAVLSVAINIKPGGDPNSINLCSGGSTSVTIFGSEELDVALIDAGSLRFASADVKTVGKADKTLCSIEDVGAQDSAFFDSLDPTPDGFDDLTCHYVTEEITNLDDTSTTADVMGAGCDDPSNGCLSENPGFFEFSGTDSVKIVKDCL